MLKNKKLPFALLTFPSVFFLTACSTQNYSVIIEVIKEAKNQESIFNVYSDNFYLDLSPEQRQKEILYDCFQFLDNKGGCPQYGFELEREDSFYDLYEQKIVNVSNQITSLNIDFNSNSKMVSLTGSVEVYFIKNYNNTLFVNDLITFAYAFNNAIFNINQNKNEVTYTLASPKKFGFVETRKEKIVDLYSIDQIVSKSFFKFQ